MNLLFGVVFVIWIGSEVTLSSIVREKRVTGSNSDRNTLRTIWIVTVSAVIIAAIVSRFTNFPIGPMPESRYVGIAIIVIGIALRISAIVSLGRMFTYNVAIRDGHELVAAGLYRLVRHPSYTGMLITFAGYGLALNNWLGLATAFIPVFVVMRKRMAIEEAVLLGRFGDMYAAYMKRSWRLVPWVF
ncbi:methyltransferase family protein [Paraburkholderia sacchari]|uniref:methyltransferase family protein n=1 Tax=Paraburkholderia sacchari TaxID=159450 RepID=UPI001BCF4717|nr:isoprenylcysteine carboxylmethyltransferase family protein [Paraburkholderia sacchari]